MKTQLEALQRQLELLEVDKKDSEGRLEQALKKNEELEEKGGWRWRRTHIKSVPWRIYTGSALQQVLS